VRFAAENELPVDKSALPPRDPPKVRVAIAEIPDMARKQPHYPDKHPIWAEARALEASIRAIRRAQGKKNPEDFPAGSPECTAAMNEFVRDVCRVLDVDLDALDPGADDL